MNQLIDVLSDIKVSTAPEDLICYGFDASGLEAFPSAVVWPANTEEGVKVIKYAYEDNISLVPRGAGTGMTAGAVPSNGAVILSFEKMNRILEIDSENFDVLCEPGLINGKLQRELKWMGLFYPPDPASMNFCTIGGNVAENAGGPRAVKYGVTKDYVLGREVVLPSGKVLRTGAKTFKNGTGCNP